MNKEETAQLAVVIEKLDSMKDSNDEEHGQIIKRLDISNGNVAKNTAFRNGAMGGLKTILGLGVLGGFIFGGMQLLG